MTASLRERIPDSKREAHETLDRVRAGIFVAQVEVRQALLVLGDGAGQRMGYTRPPNKAEIAKRDMRVGRI